MMYNSTTKRYDDWRTETPEPARIIHLSDHRRQPTRRKNTAGDVFWNTAFVGLCLSVLIILFFH